MSFTVIRVNWFPGQHTGSAGVLITRVLIKYCTLFLQKWNSSWLWEKAFTLPFCSKGECTNTTSRMYMHPAPRSNSQIPRHNNICQSYPGLVAGPEHRRSSAQIGIYETTRDCWSQTALYVTETLKQIRLCTDGSTAPIVNCGTRAWDDNHLLFIKDCVFCEDPSIPQGAK